MPVTTGLLTLRDTNLRIDLYFEKNLVLLDETRNLQLSSYAEAYADTAIDNNLKSNIQHMFGESISNDLFAETSMMELSYDTCEGTIELDCFSLQLSPSVKLYGLPSIEYVLDYCKLSLQEYISKIFLSQSDALLRRLQGSSDETLSKLVNIKTTRSEEQFEIDSIEDRLLYEEAYTLNFYLPMVIFLVMNFIALLAGLGLLVQNTLEERSDDIIKMHRKNQDRLVHNATLATEEETMEEEEVLEMDGFDLTLDATNDGFELTLI
jgi:hypothetical protein